MKTVRHAAVKAFCEFVPEIRVGNRVAKASQVLAVIAHDIAIVQRNHFALVPSQEVSERRPTATSLTLQANINRICHQHLENMLDTGTVIPNNSNALRQY